MQDINVPEDKFAAAKIALLIFLLKKFKIHCEIKYHLFLVAQKKINVWGTEKTVWLAYFAKSLRNIVLQSYSLFRIEVDREYWQIRSSIRREMLYIEQKI